MDIHTTLHNQCSNGKNTVYLHWQSEVQRTCTIEVREWSEICIFSVLNSPERGDASASRGTLAGEPAPSPPATWCRSWQRTAVSMRTLCWSPSTRPCSNAPWSLAPTQSRRYRRRRVAATTPWEGLMRGCLSRRTPPKAAGHRWKPIGKSVTSIEPVLFGWSDLWLQHLKFTVIQTTCIHNSTWSRYGMNVCWIAVLENMDDWYRELAWISVL